jgi:hypothetical protein
MGPSLENRSSLGCALSGDGAYCIRMLHRSLDLRWSDMGIRDEKA